MACGPAYRGVVMPFLTAVLPTVGVLFIFWIAIRAMLEADRRERSAQSRFEAAERLRNAPAAGGTVPPTAAGDSPNPSS